jgi:hypothetical protein
MTVETCRGPAGSERASPSASEDRYPATAAGTARSRRATAAQSSAVSVGMMVKALRT